MREEEEVIEDRKRRRNCREKGDTGLKLEYFKAVFSVISSNFSRHNTVSIPLK